MTRPQRTAVLLLVLAVAAGVRLANLLWVAGQPVSEYQRTWPEGDMLTHWRWSDRILAGDLLGRDTYHPYPSWMEKTAPLETWERWRGGRSVFHKAPLYPYALAAMRAVVGDGYLALGLCQLALGVLNVALIFLLAERYFGAAVATLAGLGAAVYGPFLLNETLFLRDGVAVAVSLLLLLALARCTDARPGPWLLAGAAFALGMLGRELVMPFGALVVLWVAQRFWGRWREAATALGAFAVGVLLGLSPLIARNLTVGAPPFAVSAIGLESFIFGHAVDTAPAVVRFPAATGAILAAADGRPSEVVRGTLATYNGDWGRLVRNEAGRTAAIFAAYEGSDNVNWYYFAERSALLRFALRWELVLALGLVGIWLARRTKRGDDRIVLYYLAIALAGLQLLPVVGRYRLVPAALLLIYAAVTVQAIVGALRAREWRAALAPAAASALLVVVSRSLLVPDIADRCRAAEYVMAAQTYLARQQLDGVYGELRGGLVCLAAGPGGARVPPGFGTFVTDFATVARGMGRTADAALVLERLAAIYRDPTLPPVIITLREAGSG